MLFSLFLTKNNSEKNTNNVQGPTMCFQVPFSYKNILSIFTSSDIDTINNKYHNNTLSEYIDNNFEARYKYGNRRMRNGKKMCHWNKGSAFVENNMGDIESIISEYKPHLLGLSEANFKKTHDLDNIRMDDYDIYFSKTLSNPDLNISRAAVYVHNSLNIKIREDLMKNTFSSI